VTVRLFQWPKAANIKWLEEMRGMRRHTERDDVVLLAMELEFGRVVALVAVKDQQPVLALCSSRRMVVEVLDPIQANGIGSPAIVGSRDTPIGQEIALGIPVGEVVLRGQDNEWRDGSAKCIDALDYRCPFAVARLGQLRRATAIRGCNHHTRADNAHYKPCLVEVVDIVIYNAVLGLDVPYESKPFADDLWILALSPLVVVSMRLTCMEGWLAFDKSMGPELADRGRVAYA
jgi:hypothetical protein